MGITVLLFILGLAVIIKCGDWFVDAAVWMAKRTGMPRMLIGATVVSLATTLPEFFVSVIAVAQGSSGLGVGNALGSVICNTGLILALSVMVRPPHVERPLFFVKAGFMVLSLVMLFLFCLDSLLSPLEAAALFVLLFAFIYYNIRHARNGSTRIVEEAEGKTGANVFKFIAGALGIVLGARLLVSSAVKIAAAIGVSDNVIGLTIVALGTSLPELVTAITALRKKEAALGIGNVLGANILNIALVLASCAVVSGGLTIESSFVPTLSRIMPRSLYVDMPVAALLFALLILPPIFLKGRLVRLQGVLMLGVYAAFILFLILNA